MKQKKQRQRQKNKNENKRVPLKKKNQTQLILEKEKKLTDQMTVTEKSSKITQENESLKQIQPHNSNDFQSINEVIKDLEGISLYQETKSEWGREDEYKLEKDIKKDDKLHHETNNLDPSVFSNINPNTEPIKVTSLSTKECDKIENVIIGFVSEEGSNFKSPAQWKAEKSKNIVNMEENAKENSIILNLPQNELKEWKSNISEVVRLKSEEKYVEEMKEVHTIPTWIFIN